MPPKQNTKSSKPISNLLKSSSTTTTSKGKDGKTKAPISNNKKIKSIKPKAFATKDIAKYFANQAECSDGGSEDEDDDDNDYDEDDSFIDNSSQVCFALVFLALSHRHLLEKFSAV